jgi:predicted metal-dependent hydrolase
MSEAVSLASKPGALKGETVGIPPRQMDFKFTKNTPRYFYDNNATATTFFAMLSGFFPPGERYFMESVRHFRERIKDERLKAEISGFMGQEAIHGREHDKLNELLAAQGFDMKAPEVMVNIALAVLNKMPASMRLSATTFMEHFTALLAEQLLTDDAFQRGADPEMIKIWQWHALEELEHKTVAYDVYETIGNSHGERVVAAIASAIVLLPTLGVTWALMLYRDGCLGNLKDNARGMGVLFGRQGFVTKILPRLPEFIAKDFHPKKHDTKALENDWRERLFSSSGALLGAMKNKAAA